jgi:Ca-activated chloride channel homolog
MTERREIKKIVFACVLFCAALVPAASAQSRCLSPEEAKKVIASMRAPEAATENKKLRSELLDLQQARAKVSAKITADLRKNQNLIAEAAQAGEKNILRVCQLLRENGWLGKKTLREDGFEALIYLVVNNKAYQLQRELLVVFSEAAKAGEVKNPLIAALVDGIRIGSGQPQIFGTQAVVTSDVVYLYPLLNPEKVDEWRRLYDLPPLDSEIRALEDRYLLPALIMQQRSRPALSRKKSETDKDVAALGIADDEAEVLKIDTRLVNLNARLVTPDLKAPKGLALSKDDFAILEDGVEQEIAFFSTAERPFDLVLALDFSGSTTEKRGLIKKAAQRFVEYARPSDRVAVVAFADEIRVVSELTGDKQALAQKIKEIEIDGGSPIWDALKFTYRNIIEKQSAGRRSAVVLMTDGEDGSQTETFADAMELVRQGETTIFPVYLDNGRFNSEWREKYRRKSQQSLSMLAEESGGQFYRADSVNDLSGIYEQIINDVGQLYSLGYEPKNEARDGGWRTLEVKVKTQPNLLVKTRRGYYAR